MPYNIYDVGDRVRFAINIVVTGTYVNPNHLSYIVQNPSGEESEFIFGVDGELVQFGAGKYYIDYYIPTYGQFYYRWYASGTAWGAEEVPFFVRKPNV